MQQQQQQYWLAALLALAAVARAELIGHIQGLPVYDAAPTDNKQNDLNKEVLPAESAEGDAPAQQHKRNSYNTARVQQLLGRYHLTNGKRAPFTAPSHLIGAFGKRRDGKEVKAQDILSRYRIGKRDEEESLQQLLKGDSAEDGVEPGSGTFMLRSARFGPARNAMIRMGKRDDEKIALEKLKQALRKFENAATGYGKRDGGRLDEQEVLKQLLQGYRMGKRDDDDEVAELERLKQALNKYGRGQYGYGKRDGRQDDQDTLRQLLQGYRMGKRDDDDATLRQLLKGYRMGKRGLWPFNAKRAAADSDEQAEPKIILLTL